MSTFLRQFNMISSLKTSVNKDLPIYKVILPVLSWHPATHKMYTQTINKNLQLKSDDEIQNFPRKKKPLAVILAWMLAKDIHIDRFSKLYIARGFDVLVVKMVPKDLLFPVSGSQVIAKYLLDYFTSHKNYDDIFVHAFSVGGYLMGELFVQMRKEAHKYKDVNSRIRGVIFDSVIDDIEGFTTGISHAVTKNPIAIKIIQWYATMHLAFMFNVATKHYIIASKNIYNTPLRCPAIVFFSDLDKMSQLSVNQFVVDSWQARGVDVEMKCWKNSKHLEHLFKHKDEYTAEVDKLLCKINLFSRKL